MMWTHRKWQSPKERSRTGRDFKGLSEELEWWGDISDIGSTLPCGVFYSGGQNILFERQVGKKNVFRRVGADMWWNCSLILLHICTRSVPAHYLFFPFIPWDDQEDSCLLAHLDHFWSAFNKILVQILTSWSSLSTRLKGETGLSVPCVVIWRRLEVQPMGLASFSWWGTSLSLSAPQFFYPFGDV